MSEQPKSPPAHTPPPVLQRVPRPGAPGAGTVPAAPAAAAPAPASPPAFPPPAPAARAPAGHAASRPPEVTAAVAIAANLPGQGSLGKEGPLHLCYLAGAAEAAGRLSLESERGAYALVFKKGVVEHAASTYAQDDLGQFLVKRGVVGEEPLAQARQARDDFGGDLLGALVGLRLIDPSTTFQVLQEHGAGLVWRALATEAGTWRWEPGVAPPRSSFPLGSRWGVLCDAVRRIDAPGVLKRLGPRAGRAATRVGSRIEMTALHLTSQEVRACGLFDGVRSVEEIAAANPAESDAVRRMALLLAETELLAFGAERHGGAAPRPGAAPPASGSKAPPPSAAPGRPAPSPGRTAPPAPPRPGSSAAAPAPPTARPPGAPGPARPAAAPPPARQATPPSATPEQLQAAHEKMKRAADHFEVLGLKRDAAPAQIKAAYFRLAKAYHPDAAMQADPPEMTKLRADIFARVSEAWSALGDDRRRVQYLEELESGGAVDVMAILQAENLFQMATVLVKARKYEEAAAKLDEAVKLNGDEPEFGVWQAWLQFLLAPPERKKPQRATGSQVIEAALRKNPRCIPGYLFLGQMAKLDGDAAGAERAWKRGLAQDERNADLLRELRYLRK